MPTQYQIEQMAGITDDKIAEYIMKQKTSSAKNAMSLLKMQCDFYEPGGMALLKASVNDCRKEMEKQDDGSNSATKNVGGRKDV